MCPLAVRDDDAEDAAAERLERLEIRMHDVDAEPAVVERHAAIDDDDLTALLERHAVHPDLAEAAERKSRSTDMAFSTFDGIVGTHAIGWGPSCS